MKMSNDRCREVGLATLPPRYPPVVQLPKVVGYGDSENAGYFAGQVNEPLPVIPDYRLPYVLQKRAEQPRIVVRRRSA